MAAEAEEHLRLWLAKGLTGCVFARLFAEKSTILMATFKQPASPAEDIDKLFEAAAALGWPAIAIFPAIRTERQLADQLQVLSAAERWTITREQPAGVTTDDVFVGMRWRVKNGLESSPMGLAPFATMPVTRRAPYVCVAAWPGEAANPYWTKGEPGVVHFLDSHLGKMTREKYKQLSKESKDQTTRLLSELADDARLYRNVAFRLQAATVEFIRDIFANTPG